MQDEHSLFGFLRKIVDDASRDDSKKAESGHIIAGCVWCQNDPEATYDDQRLKDEARDIEVLIEHLELHLGVRLLARSIATHAQNVSFHVIEP